MVRLYAEADRQGLGSLTDPDNGEMIDEATIKMAFKLLLKGYRAGKLDGAFLAEVARTKRLHTGYNFLGVNDFPTAC